MPGRGHFERNLPAVLRVCCAAGWPELQVHAAFVHIASSSQSPAPHARCGPSPSPHWPPSWRSLSLTPLAASASGGSGTPPSRPTW